MANGKRYKRKSPLNSTSQGGVSGTKTYLVSQLDRVTVFPEKENSAPARLLREPSQLLKILAQAQQVRLVVGTLHEAHLLRQEVALVGPLGV